MTLRQKKLLEELPKNNYNLSKSAKKAGYSESSANSTIYTLTRKSKNLKEYFTEDTVKKDIKKIKRLTLKNKDFTNYLRATELQSKILGMVTDKHQEVPTDKQDNQFSLDRLAGLKRDEKPSATN